SLNAYLAPVRPIAVSGLTTELAPLALRRQSSEILSDDYNLFVSDEVVFTADPRAIEKGATNVAAGDYLRALLLPAPQPRSPGDADLSWPPAGETEGAKTPIRPWRMDLVPTPALPAPPVGTSTGTGDVLGVFLHSGEFSRDEADLSVPARALGFTWSRHHR